MHTIIEKCEELLVRFEESKPTGNRWHTPDRRDFVELIKIVKQFAEIRQHDHEEFD